MDRRTAFLACAALALAGPVLGAPVGVVEAVQYPAWIERGGRAEPLQPGTKLEPTDKLRTGDDGRVRMKLAEGSTVKVGARANFVIEKAEQRGVFKATLAATAGAFRFTTDPARKGEARDVEIRALNATAGVRGTDLWGKSTPERTFIVLIEGRIEVASPGNPAVTIDKPLDYYERRAGAAPAVKQLDAKTLAAYAAETEMAPAAAVGTEGGRWSVVASSTADRAAAAAVRDALRSAGYPATLAEAGGKQEVVIAGLAGEAEARTLAASVRPVKGVTNPEVRGPR